MNWLKGKKTYFLVAFGILMTLVEALTGDITFMEFLTSGYMTQLLELLGIGGLRAGVSKVLTK